MCPQTAPPAHDGPRSAGRAPLEVLGEPYGDLTGGFPTAHRPGVLGSKLGPLGVAGTWWCMEKGSVETGEQGEVGRGSQLV